MSKQIERTLKVKYSKRCNNRLSWDILSSNSIRGEMSRNLAKKTTKQNKNPTRKGKSKKALTATGPIL